MKLNDLKTGYFAHPERPQAEFPAVHAVTPETLPLCGEAVQEGFEYQWCSAHLEGPYIDCQPCKTRLAAMVAHEEVGRRMAHWILG